MSKSLADYAAANPLPEQLIGERESMAAAAKSMQERAADRETADQLKQSVLNQLQQGNNPEIILYTALECIGLLTNDPEYISTGTGYLDTVWADLAQQSFLRDNATIASERLEKMQEEYKTKLRNSIDRQLSGYRRIERALKEVITALDNMDPEQPILSD